MHNAPVPIVLPILFKMGSDLVNEVMVHPEVQNLLKSNEKFDVCIIEIFNADAFLVSITQLDSRQCLLNFFYLRVSLITTIAFLSLIQLLAPSSGLMT